MAKNLGQLTPAKPNANASLRDWWYGSQFQAIVWRDTGTGEWEVSLQEEGGMGAHSVTKSHPQKYISKPSKMKNLTPPGTEPGSFFFPLTQGEGSKNKPVSFLGGETTRSLSPMGSATLGSYVF